MKKSVDHVKKLIENNLPKLESEIHEVQELITSYANVIENEKVKLNHLKEKRNQYISYLEESK
ncbi:hypothetical protein [Paenisporosarcina cavernae]|uniref:Uncharacterized protein n=1 Tax=Paenisporosarcina cavernae TaxID=2320858 RepID=A0A385YUR6_9BACL|nr:hypothetical protein [Paenisporosarcina cavernae]AYC30030.1 hypothetical protein D3873_09150 [Paenisporosarcina cavernae]